VGGEARQPDLVSLGTGVQEHGPRGLVSAEGPVEELLNGKGGANNNLAPELTPRDEVAF